MNISVLFYMISLSIIATRGLRYAPIMRGASSRKLPSIDDFINTGSSVIRNKHKSANSNLNFNANSNKTPQYKPRGPNQELYVESLNDPEVSVLLSVGPAGTGKTLFACNAAVQQLKRGTIQKIIVTRPLVSVEEELGFLPGNLIRKMDPWTRPLFDILGEFYNQKDIDAMLASGVIEISPLAFMRGRTFKRAFVIADEMQNSSPNQMMMLATRLGEESKLVITGDLKQSDRMENNGLADLMKRIKRYVNANVNEGSDVDASVVSLIRLIEFDVQDIQRSPVVNKILELYEDFPNKYPPLVSPSVSPLVSPSSVDKKNDCALVPDDPLLNNKARLVISGWYKGAGL